MRMPMSTSHSIGEMALSIVSGLGVGAICSMFYRSAAWIKHRFKDSRGARQVQAFMLRVLLFMTCPLVVSIALFHLLIGLRISAASFLALLMGVAFVIAVEIKRRENR